MSDNPLIFAADDEALSGGNFHAEPVAFAADIIALALCEIGSLAERRIAMLVDPALSGLPAFLTAEARPELGLHARRRSPPRRWCRRTSSAPIRRVSIRSRPRRTRKTTSRMAAHFFFFFFFFLARAAAYGWSRTRSAVIGIELLTAAQACDFHAPLESSTALKIRPQPDPQHRAASR